MKPSSPLAGMITEAYDTLGLKTEDIAVQFGVEPEAVALMLRQTGRGQEQPKEAAPGSSDKDLFVSEPYSPEQLFGKDQVELAAEVITNIALRGENEKAALEAGKYIIAEAQGRNRRRRPSKEMVRTVNFFTFNQKLVEAKSARERMEEKIRRAEKVVEAEVVH